MIYVTHDQVEAMTMGTRICVMNHGRVVQVGRPLEVYRNPADTFVAALHRQPAREPDRGRGGGGRMARSRCASPGRDAALPRHRAADLAALDDRRVVFGIRPEDIDVRAAASVGAADGAGLPARLVAVEPLGAETILVLAPDGLA